MKQYLVVVLVLLTCVAAVAQEPHTSPLPGSTWQWQLTGSLDSSFDVDVYDIDLFEVSAQQVAALKKAGRYTICYMSAGSYEDWRPDIADFPKELLGNNYAGWPGERWLDIRAIEKLAPVMRARLDLCRDKGFDGVEPDNIDGYTNNTGFSITAEDQIRFNKWFADEAHQRGLSVGLKNDSDQVAELVEYFDWALTEDCFVQGWCEQMLPFINSNKAVFSAEYTDTGMRTNRFCDYMNSIGFSGILKNRNLTASLQSCS